MKKLIKLLKQTNNKWLNLYKATYINKKNKEDSWEFSSRHDPLVKRDRADAIVVPVLLGNKMVVIKQFRPALGDYIIENVAGLIEDGYSIHDMARKEVWEETGLKVIRIFDFHSLIVDEKVFNKILFNSPGMTDDSVTYVFAEVEGEPTNKYAHDSEDIEVLTLDRFEAKELMNSEVQFSAKCWLILMAWISGHDWFWWTKI